MMDGNALFLVCVPCSDSNQKDYGVRLGERSRVGYYESSVPNKQLDNWFMKHAKCGGRANPDHFKLAMLLNPNHDQQVKLKAVQ